MTGVWLAYVARLKVEKRTHFATLPVVTERLGFFLLQLFLRVRVRVYLTQPEVTILKLSPSRHSSAGCSVPLVFVGFLFSVADRRVTDSV